MGGWEGTGIQLDSQTARGSGHFGASRAGSPSASLALFRACWGAATLLRRRFRRWPVGWAVWCGVCGSPFPLAILRSSSTSPATCSGSASGHRVRVAISQGPRHRLVLRPQAGAGLRPHPRHHRGREQQRRLGHGPLLRVQPPGMASGHSLWRHPAPPPRRAWDESVPSGRQQASASAVSARRTDAAAGPRAPLPGLRDPPPGGSRSSAPSSASRRTATAAFAGAGFGPYEDDAVEYYITGHTTVHHGKFIIFGNIPFTTRCGPRRG